MQNTLPPQRPDAAMTQVPPLALIGSGALRRVNRNIVVSGAEEKQKKRKKRDHAFVTITPPPPPPVGGNCYSTGSFIYLFILFIYLFYFSELSDKVTEH